MEKVLSTTSAGSRYSILWYWLPVLLYASLIFYLSSLPHPEDELPDFLFKKLSDKFLHLVEYAVLGLLCYRALRWAAGPSMARRAVMITIMAVSFYGMTDEVHQAFVPFRESSWLDWLADTLGGVIGAVGLQCFAERDVRAGLP
jgi:VanZ like family